MKNPISLTRRELMARSGEAFEVWREPFTQLRSPLIFNLRRDPYERARDEADAYNDYWQKRTFIAQSGGVAVLQFLMTFKDYPPSQTTGSYDVDSLRKKIEAMGKQEQ